MSPRGPLLGATESGPPRQRRPPHAWDRTVSTRGGTRTPRLSAQPPPQLTLAAYMYMCIYVCMHVCMYACTYLCIYVCMCMCMHLCTCIHVIVILQMLVVVFLSPYELYISLYKLFHIYELSIYFSISTLYVEFSCFFLVFLSRVLFSCSFLRVSRSYAFVCRCYTHTHTHTHTHTQHNTQTHTAQVAFTDIQIGDQPLTPAGTNSSFFQT